MEGNVEHALFYAPPEFREEWGDRLHSVPSHPNSIFSYADRCEMLGGMAGLHHAGYVVGNSDGLHYLDTLIDKVKSGEPMRSRPEPEPEPEFVWVD